MNKISVFDWGKFCERGFNETYNYDMDIRILLMYELSWYKVLLLYVFTLNFLIMLHIKRNVG